MDLRNIGALVFIWLCLVREIILANRSPGISRGFLIYNTILTTRQSCNCSMSFSCSCCQSVMILYTRKEKNLCVNFTYQRNGLNVDVALSSDTISTRTVTNFRPFQFCVYVPGCLFSTACANILQLNQFPSSIMACLRLDIYAKKRLWQINYDCISVSMELPMMSTNDTVDKRMTDTAIEVTSAAGSEPSPMTEASTEMPVTEVSVREMPVTEVSVTEMPVTEVSVTEMSVTEMSVTEASVTEASVTEVSVTEAASSEMTIVQTSEMNVAETSGRLEIEEVEMFETDFSDEIMPIK